MHKHEKNKVLCPNLKIILKYLGQGLLDLFELIKLKIGNYQKFDSEGRKPPHTAMWFWQYRVPY